MVVEKKEDVKGSNGGGSGKEQKNKKMDG